MSEIPGAGDPTTLEGGDPDALTRARQDELLAVRCQLGERAAFDDLIRRFDEPLWRYARRFTGRADIARDVTQDVWVRVLRGIGRLRDGARLRSWIFGIARRTMMDRLRRQYAWTIDANVDPADLAAAEGDPGDLEADLAALQSELARLPVVEREVLSLFYLEELSLQDVAEVMGVPVGTVKSRLHRARRLLRHELDAAGGRS